MNPRIMAHLPHWRAMGRWQMETDAALLSWCAAGAARLVFRTYEWDGPTLSLGRAEPFPAGWDERALERDGVRVVRRPTGGDAVLHDEEVTFAVAASLPGPWGITPRTFANRVAGALAGAFTYLGVPAERVAGPPPERSGWPRSGDSPCFARSARGEVAARGFKVAGLACRFARGAALCHGSVPLSARHRDVAAYRADRAESHELLLRNARSASELAAEPIEASVLIEELADEVARQFGAERMPAAAEALGLAAP